MARRDQVILRWLNGGSGTTASTGNGSLSTRDGKLYSYNLLIGDRSDGKTKIWDYTASGVYYSQTTSCHVGLALRLASDYTLVDPSLDTRPCWGGWS